MFVTGQVVTVVTMISVVTTSCVEPGAGGVEVEMATGAALELAGLERTRVDDTTGDEAAGDDGWTAVDNM